MKKLTLLFVFACLAYAGAMAKSVVFTLVDGTKVYYLLGGETNPKLRFVEGKMTVDADVYEFSDIKSGRTESFDFGITIDNCRLYVGERRYVFPGVGIDEVVFICLLHRVSPIYHIKHLPQREKHS